METHYVDVTYSTVELAGATPTLQEMLAEVELAGATPTLQEMLAEVIEEMGVRAAIEEMLS